MSEDSICLVVAHSGAHEPGEAVRAFATESEAREWASSEQARVDAEAKAGGGRPEEWGDGTHLFLLNIPFGKASAIIPSDLIWVKPPRMVARQMTAI